jgi:methylmalonyl-CoA/ethylmalonyl-CoA epimerase
MLAAIDHVGVAVADIDSALALYRDTLGMPLVHRETVTEQGVDAALLDVGDGHVELLQPLGAETAVGKFLSRRGPGLPRRRRGGDARGTGGRGHAADR